MRIALLSPVWFPVPPTGYGGIEWVVSILADSLADAGHDVTLFASGDSRTKAKLVSVYPVAPSERIGTSLTELHHALACYERADQFDVVNDHSGLPAAALGGAVETAVVHTVHGPLDGEAGPVYEQVARVAPHVGLISLSLNQRKPLPGLPLKLAGKMREPLEKEYFETHVRPNLGWGIEYLGEISHEEKVSLLQHARATLFPISWEEPFGLVMIESMACGTPVIATRWGAVAEVIEHGRDGLIVDDHLEMVDAIAEADRLDPLECRRAAEERFSSERMVRDYEEAYRAVISSRAAA